MKRNSIKREPVIVEKAKKKKKAEIERKRLTGKYQREIGKRNNHHHLVFHWYHVITMFLI